MLRKESGGKERKALPWPLRWAQQRDGEVLTDLEGSAFVSQSVSVLVSHSA